MARPRVTCAEMTDRKQPPPPAPRGSTKPGAAGTPSNDSGTDPLPVDVSGVKAAPSSAVTMLQEYGGELQLSVPPTRAHASLGSAPTPHVDLTVPRKYVSRLHAIVERRDTWIIVTNKSQNGTFFRGREEPSSPVKVGDRFTIGETELLALDDFLVVLREQMLRHIGFGAYRAVDEALVKIADEHQPPLLLSGPRGSEPELLAKQIHRGSSRRDHPFKVIDDPRAGRDEVTSIVNGARGGVVFVDLSPLRGGRASKHLADALFGPAAPARPIVFAPSLDSARTAFDGSADKLEEIPIPAVSDRLQDVAQLINLLLRELKSPARVEALARDRQEAVCSFEWPLNLADLRRNAPRLGAYLENDCNLSAAARSLGVDDSGLGVALARIGAVVRQPSTGSTPRGKR